MPMTFEFATATRIILGAGTLKQIGSLASAFGQRGLIVTGRDQSRVAGLQRLLASSGITSELISISGEPDLSSIERGVVEAKRLGSQFVISFGGGSAIDAGKAIAAMLSNEGELLDYLEIIGRGKALTKPSAPFIAIPTTAGTGSEVTRNSVLASHQHRVKVSLRSPLMLARLALVDPELTYDLPAPITASTGLDALTQLIEPYVCTRAHPLTDALCIEGLHRVANSIRPAFKAGDNVARQDMSVASLFGGLALANAGLGAVHGFAGPIGGMFSAPHGAICAALLPHVMAANIRALNRRDPNSEPLRRFRRVAEVLTNDRKATEADGALWVRTLVSDLQIPPLSKYGITRSDIPELVDKAAKASSMKPNPIVLTTEELSEVLEQAL
jgi:alcohol dehydrogenase class IV